MSKQRYSNTAFVKMFCLIALLVFLLTPAVFAKGKKTEELKKQLESVEEELRVQKENLEEQRTSAASLERKVECNWKLLKSYEQCEENYPKGTKQFLDCMKESKSKNGGCDAL